MQKKKLIRYIVIALILVAVVFAYLHFRKGKNKAEWRTDVVSEGAIREVVTATGSLNPYILVEVGTEVSGKIEKVYKDFNDRVKKGELLAKLDTEILQTNLDAARSDLARAQSSVAEAKYKYELAAELLKKNMTSEYEERLAKFAYEQAQQSLANSKISTQRAEKNLANAYITSPIDGIIVSRNVETGQTVAASLNAPVLFKIANNLDQMQITAAVDEADIGKISVGLPVEFNVDAYPNESFEGSVKQVRLNPETEQNVVSYSVIIDASNPEHKLLPGMTTNVTIIIQSKEQVVRLPETATRFRPSKEIWEQMGLAWNDSLMMSGRKARMGMGGRPGSGFGQGRPSMPGAPTMGGKAGADSSRKARFGKMRPGGKGRPGQAQANTGQFNPTGGGGGHRRGFALVWVLDKNNVPQPVPVVTGISDGAFTEVLEGIKPGTKILTGVINKDTKSSAARSATGPGGPGMGRF